MAQNHAHGHLDVRKYSKMSDLLQKEVQPNHFNSEGEVLTRDIVTNVLGDEDISALPQSCHFNILW
jgi:hypothetical protein